MLFEAYNAAISEAARRETEASGVLPQESAQSSICGSPSLTRNCQWTAWTHHWNHWTCPRRRCLKEELQEIRCEAENLQLSQREKTTGIVCFMVLLTRASVNCSNWHLLGKCVVNLGHMEGRIDKKSTVTAFWNSYLVVFCPAAGRAIAVWVYLCLSATSEDRFAARVTCNMLYRASQRLVASGSVIFRSPLRHVFCAISPKSTVKDMMFVAFWSPRSLPNQSSRIFKAGCIVVCSCRPGTSRLGRSTVPTRGGAGEDGLYKIASFIIFMGKINED